MNHVTYRISGSNTAQVYYGYVSSSEEITEASIAKRFLYMAVRREGYSRTEHVVAGDYSWLKANQFNEDVTCEILHLCSDELEAFILRNYYRGTDEYSHNAPSLFPLHVSERANKEQLERMTEIAVAFANHLPIREAKTARQAWIAGLFTKDQILSCASIYGKSQVVNDLDEMDPFVFAHKYQLK